MWLTSEELIELTGYKRAAYQREWLERQRIRHRVNARGRVIVARDDVLGTRRPEPVAPKRFAWETA